MPRLYFLKLHSFWTMLFFLAVMILLLVACAPVSCEDARAGLTAAQAVDALADVNANVNPNSPRMQQLSELAGLPVTLAQATVKSSCPKP